MAEHLSSQEYVESLYKTDSSLQDVKESIRQNKMPEISVAPGYGRLLTLLVKLSGAKQVLEIGALGGYSGICLMRGLDGDGRLTSLELQRDYAQLAQANLDAAGFGGRSEYRIGEALDQLVVLEQEGKRFDFFFIDADKGNYPHYFEWAVKLANPGAIIVGDNIFMHGKTMDQDENGNGVRGMRRFNELMTNDPRVESTILPAYDGLAIARVRTE